MGGVILPSMLAARRAADVEEVPMPSGVKAYDASDIPLTTAGWQS